MIGTLGEAVFEVSIDRVFTFRDFSRSGSPRLEEHAVIGRKPTLEYVAPGLNEISFSIRLDRFLGVDPEKELEKIREAMEQGQIIPLIIGGKYLGRWVITKADEKHSRHDGAGKIVVAEVSIALKEVADNGNV